MDASVEAAKAVEVLMWTGLAYIMAVFVWVVLTVGRGRH